MTFDFLSFKDKANFQNHFVKKGLITKMSFKLSKTLAVRGLAVFIPMEKVLYMPL